jgi:2-keto-4-pentenoate hydratase/2-oxohepta-3-ene-1,7-dioic acid hydratase in catechol pathway
MKLLYFDDFKLGVVKNDSVVDVSAAVKDIPHVGPGDLMNGLIEQWGSYKPRLEAAAAGAGVPVSSVRIRPPVPGPRTIDCMAVNYMEDGTRSTPAPINAFHKSPSAIIGHRGRHRQEVQPCQRSRGHELHLWLYELHRRFGARLAASAKRVFPDEKP